MTSEPETGRYTTADDLVRDIRALTRDVDRAATLRGKLYLDQLVAQGACANFSDRILSVFFRKSPEVSELERVYTEESERRLATIAEAEEFLGSRSAGDNEPLSARLWRRMNELSAKQVPLKKELANAIAFDRPGFEWLIRAADGFGPRRWDGPNSATVKPLVAMAITAMDARELLGYADPDHVIGGPINLENAGKAFVASKKAEGACKTFLEEVSTLNPEEMAAHVHVVAPETAQQLAAARTEITQSQGSTCDAGNLPDGIV